MDIEQARAVALEKRQRSPETFERQLEILFANPHFGDVVTEVFPEVLDIHSSDGQNLLKKYSDVAQFLKQTKDIDTASFLALRIETEYTRWDWDGRWGDALRAVAIRWYEGVHAEDFEVARDSDGNALGVAIVRTGTVHTKGWSEEDFDGEQQYALIDSACSAVHFASVGNRPDELSSAGEFVFGDSADAVIWGTRRLDQTHGLQFESVSGELMGLIRDTLRGSLK